MNEEKGYIYIFTNPSFPELIKIGYANDVEERISRLNNNSGLPFAFRIYATYEVKEELADKDVHKIIDMLNPNLRCQEEINGKLRKREFFQMKSEDACAIFEAIAKVSGTQDKLRKYEATPEEKADEEYAEEVRELKHNKHNFKTIVFTSRGKKYRSTPKEPNGALGIYEYETGNEVISYSNPSKKEIVKNALLDLGEEINDSETLYQLMHKLEKKMLHK